RRRPGTRRSCRCPAPAPGPNWCRRRRARSPPPCRARSGNRARPRRPRWWRRDRGCRPPRDRRCCDCCAVARPPPAPALLEAWRRRRRFQYLCISERDVVGQLCALRRKADGAATERVASAVDERIEHDAEELVGKLERALLRAGRGLAGELRQRIAEIGPG